MTVQEVKKVIKKRFGSISEFSRQSGMDRTVLQILLNSKTPDQNALSRIHRKATTLKVRLPEGDIDPRRLEGLREAIMKSGGVLAFCLENPSFSKDSVFQVLGGRYKRMSPGVRRLFAHFGLLK